MVYFCVSAQCISQILKTNNLFYIIYCILKVGPICIFVDKGEVIVDGSRNKFVLIGRSGCTFIIVLGVFIHTYDIINKLF